jgi:putative flippase GtrA
VKTWERLVRYGAASVVATTVSLTTLGVLVACTSTPPTIANLLATAAGTVPSFELNRRWVWGCSGRRSVRREVGPFVALTALGLALSTVAVACAALWARHVGVDGMRRTAVIEAANLTAFGIVWIAQFVALDRVLFAGAPQSATSTRPFRYSASGNDVGTG